MYEISSRDSKPFPLPFSDYNSTKVVQYSKIIDESGVMLIDFIDKNYQLSQKELIVIGIVARHHKILATHLYKELQLSDEGRLRSYVSRLNDQGILISRGIRKGTEYLINPKLIASSKINIKPSLKTIEQPRLKALIEEILAGSPNLSISEIKDKIKDLPLEEIQKAVYKLVKSGKIDHSPGKTNRKYWLNIT